MRTLQCIVLAVGSSALSGLLPAQTPAPIAQPVPQYSTFGMIGIAAGQTARVNALALPMGGPVLAGASCQVTLQFLDEQGKQLASSTQAVAGGEAVHFDLRRIDIDTDTDRREIQATVRSNLVFAGPAMPPASNGFCSVKPTLEIFNENGRTMVALGATAALPLVLPLAAGN